MKTSYSASRRRGVGGGGGGGNPAQLYFAPTSPWNTLIPANPTLHANSASYMNVLINGTNQINYNLGGYTTALFTVPSTGVTHQQFNLVDAWFLDSVPLPSNLAITNDPSNTTEWYGAFVEPSTNTIWSSLSYQKGINGAGANTWAALTMVRYRLDGDGWFDNRIDYWGGRESGACHLGGLILKSEITAGVIPHALSIGIPGTMTGAPIFPATSCSHINAGGIPMGARVQLDPSIDVNSLSYLRTGMDRMVAKALQDYGGYIVEVSGATAFYCEHYLVGDHAGTLGNISPFSSSPIGNVASAGKSLLQNCRVIAPPASVNFDNRNTFSATGEPHH